MFDRRYPNMRRLDEAPIDFDDRKRAKRVAASVRERTDCGCAYNAVTGQLYFYVGNDVGTGVWGHPFRREDGSHNRDIESEVDDICSIIRLARIPAYQKEQMAVWAERSRQSEAVQERGEYVESRRRDAIKTVSRTIRSRGQSKHARPSAVVDGFKGGRG